MAKRPKAGEENGAAETGAETAPTAKPKRTVRTARSRSAAASPELRPAPEAEPQRPPSKPRRPARAAKAAAPVPSSERIALATEPPPATVAPRERPAVKPAPGAAERPPLSFVPRDPEAFAKNLSRLIEEAGKAATAFIKPRQEGKVESDYSEQISDVVKTLAEVGEYWMAEPERRVEAQTRLIGGYLALWNSSMRRMMGETVPPAVEPDPRDKRFQDPEWSENQFFDFLKQFYLITSRWAEAMATEADSLAPHVRHKAEFYVRQIASAIAPSNFLLTNPEVLRTTLDENAENLVRGMKMLAEDIEAGEGDLRLRQTDFSRFRVGVNLATTPGKVIAENGVRQLIQYSPSTETVIERPLLIVPPWINKFYILDLTAEKSFIKWCVDQGHTVFVVSWVNPDEEQAQKSFEHYMREGILESLDVIEEVTGAHAVNAIGYCVGGTLLAFTLAYMAAQNDRRIASATLLTTQVDFRHAGDLKVFVDEAQIDAIEKTMGVRGYLEGRKMAAAFNMLRPNDLVWPYVIGNYFKGKEPAPFDLLYWNADATRMPAANHSYYLRNCYLDNRLAQGQLTVDNVRLDLGRVTVPLYNLATREDHIAPARSVFLGSSFFGGPVTFVLSGSGHIAGVVNPPARGKYQYWTGPAPKGDGYDSWLGAAQEHPGSWWPHWQAWVERQASDRVPARTVGSARYRPIEDAPGRYVARRS
ncbi:class I poly(R)-hydroxyalkanoic acid synthase [Prosthecomicrobium pneumaticum]|uniref:Polyhydroxyalkanoate synthase n=1 Tax=Prosthecomicrobium pneumaticum TaxID=81895 RepID=A0A7W9CTN6_9HYPH|nr:class I poly(R)-hydroxyalkanoic acid synthase [Prosthecomicrobium pneumaticum]MBB5751217.1 polyhydroxyalkanoate synthase [Prosthecomicrobium pneumaticum]